ncbi:MAG: phospho-N-acetylmuramoyl-pentapeptide-transferase [Kiritimatiellaeota bacterium]|nr:phospho-N-acetylmuramoyl-pentapeptide-transferase [Kiritimatiellota bacterium]
MFYYLQQFSYAWGPLRMFGSHLFLLCLGAALAAFAILFLLPRFYNFLPRDRGRANVADSAKSAGKPTGAGRFILYLTLPALALVLPFDDLSAQFAKAFVIPNKQWGVVVCLVAAMLTGWLDDKSEKPWGRLRKGALDAVVCVATAFALCGFGREAVIWLPFTKEVLTVPCWAYIMIAAPILWFTMNATNCSDGVDGLAGSLTLLTLFTLAIFLYVVVGHEKISEYLLVPHNIEGARWAILTVTVGGAVAGYLWHNAEPSAVLMGDAGSRFLGLLVGVAALACGNPFLVFVVAPIVLVNGGTGLFKILLLKTLAKLGFDIRNPAQNDSPETEPHPLVKILHSVRFPLHDHFKRKHKWSNAQVLMRFILIQALLMPILLVLFLKIR